MIDTVLREREFSIKQKSISDSNGNYLAGSYFQGEAVGMTIAAGVYDVNLTALLTKYKIEIANIKHSIDNKIFKSFEDLNKDLKEANIKIAAIQLCIDILKKEFNL